MGKTLSDEGTSKKAWDSNAITPGTPFMDLLASSLRYWVARKLNTDPGWKDVSAAEISSLLRLTACSCKSSSRTQAFQAKVNTRLWILFGGNGHTLLTTQILDT